MQEIWYWIKQPNGNCRLCKRTKKQTDATCHRAQLLLQAVPLRQCTHKKDDKKINCVNKNSLPFSLSFHKGNKKKCLSIISHYTERKKVVTKKLKKKKKNTQCRDKDWVLCASIWCAALALLHTQQYTTITSWVRPAWETTLYCWCIHCVYQAT